MKFTSGDFVRAIHPESKRMVSALVIGTRGRILEYQVSDGLGEWWTFMVREHVQAETSITPTPAEKI